MNRARLSFSAAIAIAALSLAALGSARWAGPMLDALTPDASQVDSRILVVGFGGRDTVGGHTLIWPAHRRGIYLRDVTTAAAKGGAVAVVLVGYDSLYLIDGATDREALASSKPVQKLAIIPLQEVSLFASGGELPLATHYRVDDLSTSAAGVGLPVDHARSGRTRTVALFGRTMELTVGEPPVNVPPAGRPELAAAARTLVPSLALRAMLALPNIGQLGIPDASSVGLGTSSVPMEDGELRVRWSSALDDASDPSVVPAVNLFGQGLPAASYRGKIVLVGTTDATQTDFIDTPSGRMPELLVQANVLNTLLTQAYERPVAPWVSWLAAIVAVALVMLVWRWRPKVALLVSVVVATGWLAAVRIAAGSGHLLNPMLVPVAAMATIVLLAARGLVGVSRERRNLRALFSQYVPASVARELVESGGAKSAAAGARLTVTVLFCDLRGFTAMAARITPGQVRELLDCYYEALSPLILERGGTVMQYTGDEIFAVFGAPTPLPDSASTGLAVAHDMFAQLDELNEQLVVRDLPPVNYGIGLHTGEVVAAHVGSRIRRQYTVIGDTVNVGSRFCSLARDGQIAFSEQLRAACATAPLGEPMGGIQFKGLDHPITAYLYQAGPVGNTDPRSLPEAQRTIGTVVVA